MKTLSIKQPWASLIASGIKNVENRTWRTKHRGRIYIHASAKRSFDSLTKGLTTAQLEKVAEHNMASYPKNILISNVKLDYLTSAIIGEVDIIDCVLNHPSVWAEQTNIFLMDIKEEKPIWNWVLANPVLYDKPILNVKGALSLWEYERPYQVIGTAEMVPANALGGSGE